MSDFSHIKGENVNMVDVSGKDTTHRIATAQGKIRLPREVYHKILEAEYHLPKGPLLHTAKIAGIMAAKKTSELIPLCHPLPLDQCDINIEAMENSTFLITATVSTDSKTGVEMEALSAVNGAALTFYDMVKGMTREIVIDDIELVKKTGGKSDYHKADSDDE